jgi:hypothetical protein
MAETPQTTAHAANISLGARTIAAVPIASQGKLLKFLTIH